MRFLSFYEMISYYAETAPQSAALIAGSGKQLNFYGLREAVELRAARLKAEGKSCLGVLSDGSLACVIEIFAAVKAGLQVVMLDENASDELLRQLIAYTDIDCLWGDPELCDELDPYLTKGVADGAGKLLFFTSGTTEHAKAVVLTEKSLMASAYNGGALLPLSPQDKLLCMLPLGHVFGFVCGLLWGLSCGAAVALGRGARHYHEDCLFFKPTTLSAVPMLWGFLLKFKALNPELKLVLIGAGDCPKPLLEAANALGIKLCFGYGLTETSSGIALSLGEGDPYAMTICPDDRIRIAEDGEILISAPTCLMEGYYKREADTEAALEDGWLLSGDLGFLDEEGKLHITGRKKEMLVLPDGTKVYLPEYEQAVRAVLGTDELLIREEDGVLTLVLGKAEPGDPAEVLEKLRPVLEERPRGQQLRRVVFEKEALPRTATGKLRRW
ncbi:MAG: AMP-binding protein [Lachnospiraceae bacterium]|nr:AMP-binding protein [Lachnospiraceae bacterium]